MATSIKFSSRAFGGKRFRPETVAEYEESSQLLICITGWGKPGIAEKALNSIRSFVTNAKEDTELTIPYPQKENLQQLGNILRMATIMTSERIHSEFNEDEYTGGFEIFAAIKDENQWSYISCGQPTLLLSRQSMGIIPLCQSIDLNVLTGRKYVDSPLPNQLLGLGQNPPIQYGNIYLKESDKLFLVSRTYLPSQLFRLSHTDISVNEISSILAKDSKDIPFWLGAIDIY